ncbi:MAG: Gfo/Idh/MocA family oxidoreductase [Thermoguttaceae bacterium]|nr:Gfo/Idh/MocA family oxidoreductase [Thermoguttaceae bacterium]MDW8037727.1 Gfo/Idh/MocA family oxidoreductase [Thermoguttaceae bacterium]
MQQHPLNSSNQRGFSRREFLRAGGRLAGASALAGLAIPHVHAGEDNTIRLALIGSGSRGSGAVANALSSPNGPCKLVAMADIFEDRLNNSYKALSQQFPDQVDVPPERRFIGFDAYKRAIDCLRPGDVALLTTHAAFRAVHLEYAVQKGVHVFMEKSFAADPAGIKQIIQAGQEADKKNLKIAAGLMCRHSSARQALIEKIREGALGDVLLIRAYRMDGGTRMPPFPKGQNELLWQLRRPYFFLWASSGLFIELMIHQIDECCWILDSFPVEAHGLGGRTVDSTDCSQNLDNYSIEYTFANGAKAFVQGRYVPNCFNEFATWVHGTKCAAQFSGNIHAPTVHIYQDQRIDKDRIAWRPAPEKVNPWQAEWDVLLEAIRKDKPHNEARRAALANLAAIMGRAAVHMGRIITWQEAMASDFRFCENVAALTADSPAPVQADANGRYPVPIPGAWKEI